MRPNPGKAALAIVAAVTVLASLVVGVAQADTPTCLGRVATIVGKTGQRVIHGTPGDDVIVGGPAIRIYGHRGDDRICNFVRPIPDNTSRWPVMSGGAGNDRMLGWSNAPVLHFMYGDRGRDRLIGGAPMHGGSGADELTSTGVSEAVSLTGGPGDDVMVGGPTQDQFNSGSGHDTIVGSVEPECPDSFCDFVFVRDARVVDLEGGFIRTRRNRTSLVNIHQVWAHVFDHPVRLLGSSEADVLSTYCRPSSQTPDCSRQPATIVGRGGPDILIGGYGADILQGGDGDDLLKGNRRDDLLTGGQGDDRHNGGAGTDACPDELGVNVFVHCEV